MFSEAGSKSSRRTDRMHDIPIIPKPYIHPEINQIKSKKERKVHAYRKIVVDQSRQHKSPTALISGFRLLPLPTERCRVDSYTNRRAQ